MLVKQQIFVFFIEDNNLTVEQLIEKSIHEAILVCKTIVEVKNT